MKKYRIFLKFICDDKEHRAVVEVDAPSSNGAILKVVECAYAQGVELVLVGLTRSAKK